MGGDQLYTPKLYIKINILKPHLYAVEFRLLTLFCRRSSFILKIIRIIAKHELSKFGFILKIPRVVARYGLSQGGYWLHSEDNSCYSKTWSFIWWTLALFER